MEFLIDLDYSDKKDKSEGASLGWGGMSNFNHSNYDQIRFNVSIYQRRRNDFKSSNLSQILSRKSLIFSTILSPQTSSDVSTKSQTSNLIFQCESLPSVPSLYWDNQPLATAIKYKPFYSFPLNSYNKLGLNWAKLSSNWELTSLEIRFIALNLHANNTTDWF